MSEFRILSSAEQVAVHLRERLVAGAWQGEMPGVAVLAADLGINHKTADAALALLEREGLLAGQGARRPRRILAGTVPTAAKSLRIGFLLFDPAERDRSLFLEARHRLIDAGHQAFFAKRTLTELGMDVDKVAAFVQGTAADAWVVESGPREVIEWFAAGPVPVFAMFGFFRRLSIAGAGPDKTRAYVEAVERLTGLGHRRIALLARPYRRHPLPGHVERHFLKALMAAGIEVSEDNFPYWKDTREGFHRGLERLFQDMQPTALLVQEPGLFAAVQQFLAARGLRVPQDVSLVCDDPDPTFVWQIPSVAHIRWAVAPCLRRVIRWAANTARGRDDRRQVLTKSEFVPGGTVGAPLR